MFTYWYTQYTIRSAKRVTIWRLGWLGDPYRSTSLSSFNSHRGCDESLVPDDRVCEQNTLALAVEYCLQRFRARALDYALENKEIKHDLPNYKQYW